MSLFKTFAIISGCFSALSLAQQTFGATNSTSGPTTTTLASILAQNISFAPSNVSPITFQHTDAVTTHHPHFHATHAPNDAILFGNEVKSLSELPLETLLKIKRHLEEMTNGMAQAENVMYPVYENPGAPLSPGYLNLGGGAFVGSVHDSPEDVGFVTQNRHANTFTENGDLVNFHDHGKHDNYQQHHGEHHHGLGDYITPQPFTHKFKKKHASEMWDSEKPSKIQTIFQVSVTALSFLAFGGYLLCMILAALKAKGTAYYPSAAALTHIHNRPSPNVPVKIQTNKKRRPSYGRRRRRRSTSNNYDDNLTRDNEQILPYNEEQMFHALISVAEGYVKFNDFYRK